MLRFHRWPVKFLIAVMLIGTSPAGAAPESEGVLRAVVLDPLTTASWLPWRTGSGRLIRTLGSAAACRRYSDSPYHRWVQQVFRAGDTHAARVARDPKEVAFVIAGALEARRPRFRYPVSPSARLFHFLKGKVPSRLLRRATKFYLRLPGQ